MSETRIATTAGLLVAASCIVSSLNPDVEHFLNIAVTVVVGVVGGGFVLRELALFWWHHWWMVRECRLSVEQANERLLESEGRDA
jgi:hypothetical protein